MPAPRDLTGQTFGRLTAIEVAQRSKGARPARSWRCTCACGQSLVVASQELIRGDTKSCGCLKKEVTQERGRKNARHGHARENEESGEYRAWIEMRRRCTNKNFIGFEYYGGRGIKVCKRWQAFENFLADMGRKPSAGHSLDRFPNGDGNYEPGNCRWATAKEQANNRRKRS